MVEAVKKLEIDVVSDVVCPWCYVGKRQLEEALIRFREACPQTEINVRWQPFQLNPGIPEEGVERTAYLMSKFGPARSAGDIYQRVKRAGAEVGLTLNMDQIGRQPNTLTAHALIAAMSETSPQNDATEQFFEAYFVAGRDLSNPAVLLELAESGGLDKARAQAVLDSAEARQATADQDLQFREMGVSGVPFFIFNRKLAVNGAQGPAALFEAMQTALE